MKKAAKMIKNRILPIFLIMALASYVPAYAYEAGDDGYEDDAGYEEAGYEDDASSGGEDEAYGAERMMEAAGFSIPEGDGFLTAGQLESKQNLAEHIDDLEECDEGRDYAENEIVVMAEDEEEALSYADAFNASLVSYQYGMALLKMEPAAEAMEEYGTDMVCIAAAVSADEHVMLPAAWPNYYDEFFDIGEDYSEFTDFSYEYDDPMLSRESSRYQWHIETMDVNSAWRAGYKGQGVTVAVIDSGRTEHEDVAWTGAERIVPDDEETSYVVTADAVEEKAHGTSVSGLIGGTAGNGKGGAGIAPECSMYMIKVDKDGSISTYAESVAVNRAVEIYGADVINMSLGGAHYVEYYAKSVWSAYQSGVAVVCSAGNDGTMAAMYPASYPGAISVAATNRSDERASFSNYGFSVRYGSPGYKVSAPSKSGYSVIDGTSFSAPVISGVIAVMLSSGKITGEGSSRVDEILRLLDRSCRKASGVGCGIPSVGAALGLDTSSSVPSEPFPDTKPGTYPEEEITVGLYTENSGSAHADLIFYSTDGKKVTFSGGTPSANATRYDPAERITVAGQRTTVINTVAVNPSNGAVSGQGTYRYILEPKVSDIDISTDTGLFNVCPKSSLSFTSKVIPDYAPDNAVTYKITGYPEGVHELSGLTVRGNRAYADKNAVPGEYEITARAGDIEKVFSVTVDAPSKTVSSITTSKKNVTVWAGRSVSVSVKLRVTENRKNHAEPAEDYSVWSVSDPGIAAADIDGNTLTVSGIHAGSATVKGVSADGTNRTCTIAVTVRQLPEEVRISVPSGNVENARVPAGMGMKLSAKVMPEDTYNKAVKWSIIGRPDGAGTLTSATIGASTGLFSASKAVPGVYKVRAKAADRSSSGEAVYSDIDIEVYGTAVRSLKLDRRRCEIFRVRNAYGSPASSSAQVLLEGGSPDSLIVENPAPGLVSADFAERDGKLFLDVAATGASSGTARIAVKTVDGKKSAVLSVTVSNPPAYLELSVPGGSCTHLVKGSSMKLTAKIGDAYGKVSPDSYKLVWSSSAPEYVSVSAAGVVSARSDEGKSAVITARSANDGKLSASITIGSYANTTSITTDGLWKRMKRISDGKYFGEYIDHIENGRTAYMSLAAAGRSPGAYISSLSSSYASVSSSGEGLYVKWSSVTREEGMPNSTIALTANSPGTYYVTVKMRDKSSVTKRIRIVVE
ncbi:MAG: S8 family serine peptidase [Lachnospiraceae bacterium]|nr:S8 family serine peptidase [Lachnospiraceae bacterium]